MTAKRNLSEQEKRETMEAYIECRNEYRSLFALRHRLLGLEHTKKYETNVNHAIHHIGGILHGLYRKLDKAGMNPLFPPKYASTLDADGII